jgi:DNA-binding MltR family transcriptional regulator
MATRKKVKEQEKQEQSRKAKDWIGFLNEFYRETDRSAAILIAGMIDYWLRHLLQARFVEDAEVVDNLLENERPLGTLGSRIAVAYCLGLITESERKDLIVIKNIRNKFAHQLHGITFSSKVIGDECDKLKGVPLSLHADIPEEMFPKSSNREKFYSVGFVLAQTLEKMSRQIEHIPQRPEGRWVIIEQNMNDDGTVRSEHSAWTR